MVSLSTDGLDGLLAGLPPPVHGGTTHPAQPLEYVRLIDDPQAHNPTTDAELRALQLKRAQP